MKDRRADIHSLDPRALALPILTLWMIALSPAPALSSALSEAPPSPQRHSLSLHLDADAQRITGHLHLPEPCDRWRLPPNRFKDPITLGGELMARRVYPKGFEPITLYLALGEPSEAADQAQVEGLLHESELSQDVTFTLKLGERRGGFGMDGGAFILQGGFVPEPLCGEEGAVLYDVDITWEGGGGMLMLGGELYPAPLHLEGLKVGEMLTLMASERLQDLKIDVPGISLFGESLGRRQRAGLQALFADVVSAWERWGYDLPSGGATIALTPMELALTLEGGGVMLLSDRALNLNPRAMAAHRAPVSLGLFRHLLLESVISTALPPSRRYWAADAIAAHLALRLEVETRGETFDAQSLIKPLAFLPGFDQLLYAPRMAFAQEIYGSPFILDPLTEDLRNLRDPMPPGRVILLKLTDRFGPEVALGFIDAGLAGEDPIEGAALAAPAPDTPEAVRRFIESWEGPMPQEDLALVKESGAPGHFYVERRSLGMDGEGSSRALPEEVVLIQIDGRRGDKTHQWLAPSQGADAAPARSPTFEVGRGETLLVDPIRHVLEATPEGYVLRGNNSAPADWKVIIGGVTRSLSFQQRRFDMSGGVSLMPRYDRRALFTLDAYTNDLDLLGVSAGYFRYFGAPRDAVWRRHRAGAFARGSLARSAFEPGVSTVMGLGVGYRYESRQDLFDPRRGARVGLTIEGGQVNYAPPEALGQGLLAYVEPQGQALGMAPEVPTRPYGRLNLSGVLLRDPWATGVVALRGVARAGLGGSRPDLYYLGGGSGVRGLPADVQGARNALAGVEIRQGVAQGRPVDLGLVHLRKVDLVGFLDAGVLEGGLQTQAIYGAGGGLGLRFHLLALGLQPGLFGVDVAHGVAWEGEGLIALVPPRPQVYLRFAQGF